MTSLQLRPDERLALGLIVAEGRGGLVIDGREVRLSTAIRLEMGQLVTIHNDPKPRAVATADGRALHRTAQ